MRRISMKKTVSLILALLTLLSLFATSWAEEPAARNAGLPMLDSLIERLRANPRSLIFTEGTYIIPSIKRYLIISLHISHQCHNIRISMYICLPSPILGLHSGSVIAFTSLKRT